MKFPPNGLVCLLVASLLLVRVPAFAQSPVTRTLNWTQPNATLAEAQAYSYTSKLDTDPPIPLTPTCVAGTPVTCSAPITFLPGPHTIQLTVANAFGSASASISGAPPSAPLLFTVTCTASCSVGVP